MERETKRLEGMAQLGFGFESFGTGGERRDEVAEDELFLKQIRTIYSSAPDGWKST